MRQSRFDAFNSYVARCDVSDGRISLKVSPYFESELTQRRWGAICDVMQGLPSNSRSGAERKASHELLMNRLDRSEAEFDSGGYADGNAFLGALLERYDA